MDGWATKTRPAAPLPTGDVLAGSSQARAQTRHLFVTGGVAAAIEAAALAAGDKRVHIMGGASVVQQALRTGLVTRVRLHVAPAILGSGTALFDGGPGPALEWEETVDTPEATHLSYRCA